MKASVAYAAAVVMAIVAAGCAGKPASWRAAPASVIARGVDTDIVMEPVRQDNPFYTAFRLTLIRNDTATPVALSVAITAHESQ